MLQLASREQVQAMTTSVEPTPETSISSSKVTPVTSRVCHWLSPILYQLGCRLLMPFYFGQLKVIGQENIPKTGPVILAPTHRSRWDALLIPYAAGKLVSGRDLRFMVSEDEVKGLQGWFIRRMGGFPVNTRQPGIGSIRHSVELLRKGEALVIFPEGDIFRDGRVQPLKPGMARIALQAESSKSSNGLTIVPISIRYSDAIPHWGSDATVNIGSPIKVANYCTNSAKKGAKQLTHDLESALRDLAEEDELADAQPVPAP